MTRVSSSVLAKAIAGAFALTALLTFLLHTPCRNSGYTDSRFTSFCYSDLAALISSPPLGSGGLPYGGAESVSEAPIPAFLAWAVAQTPVGFDARIVLLQLVLLGALAVTAWAVVAMRGWRPLDAALLLLLPAWPFVLFVGMDLVSVGFAALSLLIWQRDHRLLAGLAAGCALASGFWTWILLLGFAVDAIRREAQREWYPTAAIAAVVALAWNVPKLLAGESLVSPASAEAGEGTPLFIYSLLENVATPSAFLVVAAGVLLSMGIALWATRLAFDFRVEALLLLLVCVQLLTGASLSPQQLTHLLWLLPLVWPTRAFVVAVSAPVVAYVMAVWLRFEAASENGKGIHVAWYSILSATLWVTLVLVAQRSTSVMTVQGIDRVEQSRASR